MTWRGIPLCLSAALLILPLGGARAQCNDGSDALLDGDGIVEPLRSLNAGWVHGEVIEFTGFVLDDHPLLAGLMTRVIILAEGGYDHVAARAYDPGEEVTLLMMGGALLPDLAPGENPNSHEYRSRVQIGIDVPGTFTLYARSSDGGSGQEVVAIWQASYLEEFGDPRGILSDVFVVEPTITRDATTWYDTHIYRAIFFTDWLAVPDARQFPHSVPRGVLPAGVRAEDVDPLEYFVRCETSARSPVADSVEEVVASFEFQRDRVRDTRSVSDRQ